MSNSSKNNLLIVESTDTESSLSKKFEEAKNRELVLESFLDDFINSFVAAETKKAYIKDLADFFTFMKVGEALPSHPNQIEGFHFRLYRDHLIEKQMASATINRKLVAIRSFMKWCLASGLIQVNPLDQVKLPKVKTEAPTLAFSDEEARDLIDAPDVHTKEGNTHRIIFVLLFHLGLRRSELVKIKIQDFFNDRGHFVLKIQGKGDKTRYLPIQESVQSEIRQYVDRFFHITDIELEDDDFLIQTAKSGTNKKPCNGSTIYRVVNRYAKVLDISKRVGAHSCRATVISHLLDTRRLPIRDVAHFAGHENIGTTERYDKKRKGLDESAAYDVDFLTLSKTSK